jgi:opacity protein-like surface antigen
VAGVGAEFMVDPRFTLRGELLHYEYSHETYPGSTGNVNLGNASNVLRFGGNYKF